jgi:toxin co-regulated pilus biosynthesis protein E
MAARFARTVHRHTDAGMGDRFKHALAKQLNFGAKSRIRLFERFESYCVSDIDVRTAVLKMWKRYARNDDMRVAVFRRVHEDLTEGLKINEALDPYITPSESMVIGAADRAGKLGEGFAQAAFVADAAKRLRSAVVGSLVYPVILTLMLSAFLWGISAKFIPVMLDILPLDAWPMVSRALYHVASFVSGYGLITLVVFVVLTAISIYYLPRWRGPGRAWADRFVPMYRVYREFAASTFLIGLSGMIGAGEPLDAALMHIRRHTTQWQSHHIRKMLASLRDGDPAGQALNTGMIAAEAAGDIEDFADAGNFDRAIKRVGHTTVEDSITSIKAVMLAINILMLFLTAGMLLLLYAGMILVVMTVAQHARQGAAL